MALDAALTEQRGPLVTKLTFALGGDHHAAEDLAQETLIRAWQRLPEGLNTEQRDAWLRRTAANLAIDELRRRSRRRQIALDGVEATLTAPGASESETARETLRLLSAPERLLVLLRFEAGFSHAEIGQLLGIAEPAARKRVERARAAFRRAYRAAREPNDPLILVVLREDDPEPYDSWLHRAGGRVRRLHRPPTERELVLADGIVFTGSQLDLDASLYGEANRGPRGGGDLQADHADMAALKATLALDIPMIGVCRGGQLLNIVSGGSLYQDVVEDGLTPRHHTESHAVRTEGEGIVRRLLGRVAEVHSDHHQAVKKLGRQLTVSAVSPDGVIETIERHDRRFAMGLQWHPELSDGAGDRIAEAFLGAAREQAA